MKETASDAARAQYRGRFAPSPTGPLHFGSLIAAVGSYLEARSRGGEWLVRIEDVDTPRVVPGAADAILRALEGCGLHWDSAIVYQSTRADAYHAALHELKQRGLVYPCACSRREIADSAASGIEGHVYPGTCRAGIPPGRKARALRIDTTGAYVSFNDALQGAVAQHLDTDIGDFVLYRADGLFAYQLAVVIDDAEQGVTDIVRGADLLESTPRQIYIQTMLGLSRPRYMHLPVAVNEEGEKLSKQTHAAPIDHARSVTALVNALRFLGHDPPEEFLAAEPGVALQWAAESWRTDRVPRTRRLVAPPL
ncbi:MAG: gltX [Burkholderiales bacterium]|jgi:glutamyl-Q tRNA(Asp) synthetase|nr:gltX [Burkholderiales bacterium]